MFFLSRTIHIYNESNEQLKQYAVCNEDFNEMQKMSRIKDEYDTIAPCTQNFEQQDIQGKVTRTCILTLMKAIIYQMI